MMKVYFVRHGESVDASNNIHQRPDSPLSEKGVNQAKQISARFRDIEINKIYSSTLERAKQTAEIIAKDKGLEIDLSELIVELRKPSVLMGADKDAEKTGELKKFMKENFGKDIHYSDEENYTDLTKRISLFIKNLEEEKCDSVLVICHGYVIKTLFAMIAFRNLLSVDILLNLMHVLILNNTGLTVFERNDEKWKLLAWNDIAHLAE